MVAWRRTVEDVQVCPRVNIGIQAKGTRREVPVGTLYPPNLKSSILPFFLCTPTNTSLRPACGCVPATGLWA